MPLKFNNQLLHPSGQGQVFQEWDNIKYLVLESNLGDNGRTISFYQCIKDGNSNRYTKNDNAGHWTVNTSHLTRTYARDPITYYRFHFTKDGTHTYYYCYLINDAIKLYASSYSREGGSPTLINTDSARRALKWAERLFIIE